MRHYNSKMKRPPVLEEDMTLDLSCEQNDSLMTLQLSKTFGDKLEILYSMNADVA